MTLVVANRFGNRIVVLSDTMISNRDALRANAIPGRLKSIVLSKNLTISYAGLSSQANDVIRKIARHLPQSIDQIVRTLCEASSRHAPNLDFILCAHENGNSRLARIFEGQVQEGGDFYWIGSPQSASAVSSIAPPPPVVNGLPDYLLQEELFMTHKFHSYVTSGGDQCVGGVSINCLCSEFGHCYQDHAGAQAWDIVILPNNLENEAERFALRQTGMKDYVYNVCAPAERGVGIVGFFLEQAGVGWIHDPLTRDDPEKIHVRSALAFSEYLKTYVATVSPLRG